MLCYAPQGHQQERVWDIDLFPVHFCIFLESTILTPQYQLHMFWAIIIIYSVYAQWKYSILLSVCFGGGCCKGNTAGYRCYISIMCCVGYNECVQVYDSAFASFCLHVVLYVCVCTSDSSAFLYWSGLCNPSPHIPTPEATVVTDLVSFVSPPLVHPIGLLWGEHCDVVPIGLGSEGLLQRMKSQAGTCVPLLVVKWVEGKITSAFDLFLLLLTIKAAACQLAYYFEKALNQEVQGADKVTETLHNIMQSIHCVRKLLIQPYVHFWGKKATYNKCIC